MMPRALPAIAALTACLALPPAIGADPAGAGAGLAGPQRQMKEDVIAHIDARIRILQETKVCVRAANDMKAVSDCHAQERQKTKVLRERVRAELLVPKVQRDGRRGSVPEGGAQ